jgi:IS30 family transposase
VMLVKVANKDAESVVSALIKQSQRLPSELYRSLTWDRGKSSPIISAGHWPPRSMSIL